MNDELLDIKQVSEMIGLSIDTIYHGKCGTNEIPRIPGVGRKRLYSKKTVQTWIEKRRRRAESGPQIGHRLLSFTNRKRA